MQTIILTEAILSLPYFSDFKEEQVEVPAKPHLKELLDKTLVLEELSLAQLFSCVETCIYFTLDSRPILLEILWRIGIDLETFKKWFSPRNVMKTVGPLLVRGVLKKAISWTAEVWDPNSIFPALVRAELTKTFKVSTSRLLKLGIRWKLSGPDNVSEGNFRLLKWAHENGYSWGAPLCSHLARKGYLDCLVYAHENGCPWDPETCSNAAHSGRLECLKYAHEQGCSWNSYVCYNALRKGHLDCLKYAHENGCPWDKCGIFYVKTKECLEYALAHGCPHGNRSELELRGKFLPVD